MSRQRRFILMASAIGITSLFLPWVVVDAAKIKLLINGFHSYGMIAFIAFAITGMICLSGGRHKTLGRRIWLVVVTGSVALMVTVISLLNNSRSAAINIKPGLGVWTSLFAAIVVIASALFLKNSNAGFDGFRSCISIPIINGADLKANAGISKITTLEKLTRLRANGEISEKEFDQLKSRML